QVVGRVHPRPRRSARRDPAPRTDPANGMSTPDLATPAIDEAPATAPTPAAVRTSRFSTPGEGSSTLISAITVVVLLTLWWLASHLHWVPPLFLPTPEVVFERLYESAAGQ